MGIRIQKAIGYGLTGMAIDPEDRYNTNDPRVSLKHLWSNDGESRTDTSDEAYLEHLKQYSNAAHKSFDDNGFSYKDEFLFDMAFEHTMLTSSVAERKPKRYYPRFIDGLVYNGEYGDPGTLLVVPPGMMSEWMHSDDMVDYLDATITMLETGDQIGTSVRMSPIPIFPYDGWMDTRTGQRVIRKSNGEAMTLRRLGEANMSDKTEAEKAEWEEFLDKSAMEFGYESYQHFKEVIVPLVPSQVKDFTDWLGIFTHDKVWLELRPMIYTYWG